MGSIGKSMTALLVASLLSSTALAQNGLSQEMLRRPTSVYRTNFEFVSQEEPSSSPSDQKPPQTIEPSHNPISDQPIPKTTEYDPPNYTEVPNHTEVSNYTEVPNYAGTPNCGVVPACECVASSERCRSCERWTLPQLRFLDNHGIQIGGWIDQGVSVSANNPADNYNGVVTFNDRHGEYQMNQFWLFMERAVNTESDDWDIGGRVDFVYGTDARFTQAADGLEADWGQTDGFYQAAVPQFYLDMAYRGWKARMGHFFTLIGYEVVTAPDNFFYSHAYTMQYGEPFTHTGMLLSRDVGPFSLSGGVHRGNDQFTDTDGHDGLGFLGGVSWAGPDDLLNLAFAISASEQGPGIDQLIYSVVASVNLTGRLKYIAQHDYGQTVDTLLGNEAEWYGINQYLIYSINDCWGAGLRFEWFRDDDGTRVAGLGVGNLNTGPYAGDFYAVTAGLNWSPHANIMVRPEVRWDWFDGVSPIGPYDAGDRDNQLLFGCDLICTF